MFEINVPTFKTVLKKTSNTYVEKYSWYYMPVTVHKILIHACDIVEHNNIPIGYLSEKALEARHKEIRKYRLHHSRKSSRESSNKDVLKRLLLSSEPLVTFNRKTINKKHYCSEDISPYVIFPETDVGEKECDSLEDESE